MRKSERIRQLEMAVMAQQFDIEVLRATLEYVLEASQTKMPNLDSGKWYNKKDSK
jgi:hypothetical protein